MNVQKHTIVVTIFCVIAILDGVLKYIALTQPSTTYQHAPSPIIGIMLHKNPGITFDIPVPFFIIAPITLCILFALVYVIYKLRAQQPNVSLGIVAIILGALNNFLDRAIHGFTTDYVLFFQTSVLNLSDLLIFFGAAIVMMYYKEHPRSRRA